MPNFIFHLTRAGVTADLKVDASTPEEAETKVKKFLASFLSKFPPGIALIGGDPYVLNPHVSLGFTFGLNEAEQIQWPQQVQEQWLGGALGQGIELVQAGITITTDASIAGYTNYSSPISNQVTENS